MADPTPDDCEKGRVAGTPLFLAPEQAAGRTLDGRCDLYAIGAVAYFLVAGRAPFEGRTTIQVLRALGVDESRAADGWRDHASDAAGAPR